MSENFDDTPGVVDSGSWVEVEDWETDDEFGDELDETTVEHIASGLASEWESLDGEELEDFVQGPPPPTVAIVGRPNVGKSTLVNRIIGRREAVVEDVPGVTRDRVAYPAEWGGRDFILLDTGGWERDAKGLGARIAEQVEIGVRQSDAVLFVVDATVGAQDDDEAVISVLRKANIPVLLVANKVDGQQGELDAAELWSLGLGQPYPVSALHGRGSGDLLDALIDVLPEHGRGNAKPQGPRRVALLGRPNVGKSSLLNKLAGEQRVVVDSVAGTTVDPVDELVEIGGVPWYLVDTAGIRRRVREATGHEYYATLRTRGALQQAEVAVVLLDSSESLADQDLRLISMVVEAGRALVLAYNKWDLMDDDRRRELEREYDLGLVQVQWAPRVNVSAMTGRHVDKLMPALVVALEGWETRVPTGRLNQFFKELTAAHPHPVRGGKQPRIMFGTQAGVRPPTFILFTSGELEAGYLRFVERRLREEFGFDGSPLHLKLRVRKKRARR